MLTGLYVPGDSWLHRVPAGRKLVGLLVFMTALFARPTWWGVVAAGVLVVGIMLAAGLPGRVVWAQAWALKWFVLVFAALQLWVAGWERTVVVVGSLVVAVLAASAVTLTARVADMMDAVVAGARPLRRVGVDPERLGLLLALTIRSIPVVAATYEENRQARIARGLQRSPKAILVPLVVRTVRHADRVGDALAARGLDD